MFSDINGFLMEEESNPIESIRKTWIEYNNKIEEDTLIRDALQEKYLKTVKEIYGQDALPSVISDYCENKAKKKHEFLKYMLDGTFGEQKWHIEDIGCIGINPHYGYAIRFTLDNNEYFLQVPEYKNLTLENMKYVNYGKYSIFLADVDNHTVKEIFSDYDKAKVKEFIKYLE